MTTESTKEEATAKLGKWLAAGQATFVAFAAAIGVSSGGIARIFRNSAGEAVLWLAFITFGILIGVVVSNGSTAGVTMRAGQLLLAAFGTLFAGLAALWTVLGLDTRDGTSGESGGPLGVASVMLEFLGRLPAWLFLALFFILLGAWVTARLPIAMWGPMESRLVDFFNASWSGLYWLGATALFFVVLQVDPVDLRTIAAALALISITGAITWAVDIRRREPDVPSPVPDPEQTINVNLRLQDTE